MGFSDILKEIDEIQSDTLDSDKIAGPLISDTSSMVSKYGETDE
jgi:hypothetical protein